MIAVKTPLFQLGKVVEAEIAIAPQSRPVAADIPAHGDVLVHRQVFEDPAALHHLEDPQPHDLFGWASSR